MKKHLKVLASFIKTSLIAEMEFRFSFSMFTITNIIWFFLNIVAINLIFGQVQSIAGWSKFEIMLLVTVRALFNSLCWVFVWPNFVRFHELVRKGLLDFVITKPVSSRFWATFRYFQFDQLVRIPVIIFVVNFCLAALGRPVSLANIVAFLFFFSCGLTIFYNFCFMITTTNIWFTNIFNLENLFDSMQGVGQYPSTVFAGGLKMAMVFLIPTIFISFFPTLALLGRADWSMVVLAVLFLIGTFILSQKFWSFALRHYASASS